MHDIVIEIAIVGMVVLGVVVVLKGLRPRNIVPMVGIAGITVLGIVAILKGLRPRIELDSKGVTIQADVKAE